MNEKRIEEVLKIKRKKIIKRSIIWSLVIGIPTLFLLLFFFVWGGKARYDNFYLAKQEFTNIFINKKVDLDRSKYTDSGWKDVQEIEQIYVDAKKATTNIAPTFGAVSTVVHQAYNSGGEKGVAYIPQLESFKAGQGIFSTWSEIVAFLITDEKISGIIYRGVSV